MKRRVASLPPISAETFAEKVLNAQASSTAVAAKASFEKICTVCQKTYYSENAYENHLKSQKHRLRSALTAKDGVATEDGEGASVISSTISLGEPINTAVPASTAAGSPPVNTIDPEAEEEFSKVINGIKETQLEDDEPVSRRPTRPHHSSEADRPEHPLSPEKTRDTANGSIQSDAAPIESQEALTRCLFCNTSSKSSDLNLVHMKKSHGLFIPERDYLDDMDGLLQWLDDRIRSEPHECLYCHQTKSSSEAIQSHMRDLGHCKIAFEDEVDMIEVGQFYDFRSTYSDDEMDGDDGDDETTGEDGWEDESETGSDDVDGGVELEGTGGNRVPKLRSRTQRKDQATVLDDELHLPSGKIAGHRSLVKYYRQNLRDRPSTEEAIQRQKLLEAAEERGEVDVDMTNGEENNGGDSGRGRQLVSRANGGLGMLGVPDAKKRAIQAVEKKEQFRAQRAERQYEWGVNKRANNQKHFRDPLLQ